MSWSHEECLHKTGRNLQEFYHQEGFEVLYLPIPDFGVPTKADLEQAIQFLGFTHYWGRSRSGTARLQRKTSKKRLRRALGELNQGLHQERNGRKLPDLWQAIARKMQGHFKYFGVTDNSRALYVFEGKVHHLVFKWLNRRSQRRSVTRESFRRSFNRHPLPRPGRLVSLIPVGQRAGCRGLCGKTAGRLL